MTCFTVVNDQAHGSGATLSHQKTTATRAGIVPVFILLDEVSIYTFLDLAVGLVDFVLLGGVWTPSYQRPFKIGFEFEVHLDQFFARHISG